MKILKIFYHIIHINIKLNEMKTYYTKTKIKK